MARILRGDVVWAELNPVRGHEQAGRRPVVVLSAEPRTWTPSLEALSAASAVGEGGARALI
jgi:mRNA-degrading endonuclease toxin of MazEF toxin-antitoxin module